MYLTLILSTILAIAVIIIVAYNTNEKIHEDEK